MTKTQLRRALFSLEGLVDGVPAKRFDTSELLEGSKYVRQGHIFAHCAWMLPEMKKFVEEGRLDKVQRWLGFVQGALWAAGVGTIDAFKHMNMKQEETS